MPRDIATIFRVSQKHLMEIKRSSVFGLTRTLHLIFLVHSKNSGNNGITYNSVLSSCNVRVTLNTLIADVAAPSSTSVGKRRVVRWITSKPAVV